VFLGFFSLQIIVFQGQAPVGTLSKKSYLKTYGRFSGFRRLCQNGRHEYKIQTG
jgi:hypothetical protein